MMVLNVKLDQKHWFGWFTGKFFRAPKNPPAGSKILEGIREAIEYAKGDTSKANVRIVRVPQVIHRPVATGSGDHSKKMMQPALTAGMPRAYRRGMTKEIEEITAEEFCRFRAAHDVGQRKVAEWFGVDQATVHRWEQRGLRGRGLKGYTVIHVRAVMKRKKPKMAATDESTPAETTTTGADTTAT